VKALPLDLDAHYEGSKEAPVALSLKGLADSLRQVKKIPKEIQVAPETMTAIRKEYFSDLTIQYLPPSQFAHHMTFMGIKIVVDPRLQPGEVLFIDP